MKKLEAILILIAIMGIIFKFLYLPGGTFFAVFGFTLLMMLYFAFGFALFNGIRLRKIFQAESYQNCSTLRMIGAVATGIALSVTCMGIMFRMMMWPGSTINQAFGLTALFVITILCMVQNYNSPAFYYTRIFRSILVLGVIGLFFLFLPQRTLVDINYHDDPNYKEALIRSIENPDDPHAAYELERERDRMEAEQSSD